MVEAAVMTMARYGHGEVGSRSMMLAVLDAAGVPELLAERDRLKNALHAICTARSVMTIGSGALLK